MIFIRPYQPADWQAVWDILQPVFRAGDTYSFPRDITSDQARQAWVHAPAQTFVAVGEDNKILGTYYLKANQPGQGAHVCNCGYAVSPSARGRSVATQMCEHSQAIAREAGFRDMQFNLVVATNWGAVRLWERLGFSIVGTLPGAFNHPAKGDVDAYVMYKRLTSDSPI